MLTFSLIVATLNRSTELETLLASLASQKYHGLECVIVDQNVDDRVARISEPWQRRLNLKLVRSSPGLSRARNIGMEHVTGDILAFPDDDCWYSKSLLQNVSRWFEAHPGYSVGAEDADGEPSGNRWIKSHCDIEPRNAFRTTFSSTIFVRREKFLEHIRFDESLGVGSGTAFCCGEETDYVLNLIRAGALAYFDRTWHVGHPRRDMLSGQIDGSRARGYGTGMGHVLRMHAAPALLFGFIGYDLARSVLSALKGELLPTRRCLQHALGIASGYMVTP